MRGGIRRAYPSAVLLALVCAVSAVHAQARSRFDLPAQSLADSLRAVGSQTDTNVLFDPPLVARLRAPALKGELTIDQALARLLTGTGIAHQFLNEKTVVLAAVATRFPSAQEKNSAPRQNEDAAGDARDEAGELRNETRGGSLRDRSGVDLDSLSTGGRAPGERPGALEEIIVTGTYIAHAEPIAPVLSFDRAMIERGGYASVQEVMRQLPQNFGSATPVTGGSNIGKSTQIDLRGLGSESTLTLINGRRVSSAGGDRGRAVDISMIPLAAIERIDVLTDGASALYGSDAIGGVVNLVLRKDFTGAQTTVQYGDNSTGSDDLLIAQVMGTSWSTGRALAAAQYLENGALTLHQLGIDTLDFRSRGGSDQRLRGLGDETTNGTVLPILGPTFLTVGIPAGTAAVVLPTGDGRSLSLGDLGINQISFGDFGLGDLMPKEKDASAYVLIEQDVGSVTLFVDGVYGHRTSLFGQGISAMANVVPPGCAPGGLSVNCNPYSPFAEPVLVFHALDEFGPIVNDIERDGWFVNLGGRGWLGRSDWRWELVGTVSEDQSDTVLTGLVQPAELQARLANPDRNLAFNPFGNADGQSPGVVDALGMPLLNRGHTSLSAGTFLMQGSLWQLPGGVVRLALGADYREDNLEVTQTQLAGVPLVSTSLGVIAKGSRDLAAVFGELHLPLVSAANARTGLRELAFSAAVRYEQYSDFGETVNPKFAVRWRPMEDLAFTATWGTSFRAPSLIELYATQFVRENFVAFDPNRPQGTPANVAITRAEGGNPDLQEETADTFTMTGEYRPRWLKGARLRINYFHIDYRDRIRGALDGLSQTTLFQFEDRLPPGIIVRDPQTGVLQSVFITNINSAETVVSGYDAMGGYAWDTRHGGFDLSVAATAYARFEDRLADGAPVFDLLGMVGNVPDWRGRIGLSWLRGAWNAGITAMYTDSLWNPGIAPTPLVLRDVESQVTVDAQLGFTAQARSGWLQGVTARLGASNLFDERPPFVDGSNKGLDARNAVLEGRTIYVRLTKGFGAAVNRRGNAP